MPTVTTGRARGTRLRSTSATASPMPWPKGLTNRCSSKATISATQTSPRRSATAERCSPLFPASHHCKSGRRPASPLVDAWNDRNLEHLFLGRHGASSPGHSEQPCPTPPATALSQRKQVLDVPDGLGVVLEQHRVDTRLPRPFDARLGIIEEHRLRWLHLETLTGEGVDPGVGLAHTALVGVDDHVDEVFEPVGGLLSFPGTDEAVAQDPRAASRPQLDVPDQLGVGGA